MSSCQSTKLQRFMYNYLPFLYKKCPEGNYHKVWDRLCFCQYFDSPGNGIYDFKNDRKYVRLDDYKRLLDDIYKPPIIKGDIQHEL